MFVDPEHDGGEEGEAGKFARSYSCGQVSAGPVFVQRVTNRLHLIWAPPRRAGPVGVARSDSSLSSNRVSAGLADNSALTAPG